MTVSQCIIVPCSNRASTFVGRGSFLLKLFRFHGITPSARILDAACGTGDVLADLNQLGFRNLMGIDGSAVMLRKRNGWRCLAK
jgi:SAM-dependent methyltransferase